MLAIGFVLSFFFFSGRIFGGVIVVEEIWRLFVFALVYIFHGRQFRYYSPSI